tara:strand:- start:1662 stop:4724 length:3063 start_codon:yes stop_codon:yes gene_type:complete
VRGALLPRLKRSAGFVLALTLSLLLAVVWLFLTLWASSPYWAPPLAERVALSNGVSLKLSEFARPSLAGLHIGRLQLVNESVAISLEDLTVDWTHPEAPATPVVQTLFRRLLVPPSSQRLSADLILLSVRAAGLDLHTGNRLPPALLYIDEPPKAPETVVTPPEPQVESRGRRLASMLAAFESQQAKAQTSRQLMPALNLPFGLQLDAELVLDHLRVRTEFSEAADVAQPSADLSYVADAFSIRASGLDRRPMSITLASTGDLVLPSMWREQGSPSKDVLSFSLDPLVPLQVEAAIDHQSVLVNLRSKPLQASLALAAETDVAGDAAAWRLHGQTRMDTAGQAVGFMLPPMAPVYMQALPIQVDLATAAMDIDLRLDDDLLPHSSQPENARLAADLHFDASGPPGRLRLSQVLKLGREEGGLALDVSEGRYSLDPDSAWWKRNAWFNATGLKPAALQPWRLEPRALNCQFTSWQTVVDEIPDCQWPLILTAQAGQSKATLELTPAFGAQAETARTGKSTNSIAVKLDSAGEQLHERLPERWSLSGRAIVQPSQSTMKNQVWQLELEQAALSLESLVLPDVQIDQLALKIPQWQLRIPQLQLTDGSSMLQVGSITGSGAAKLDMRFRSALLPTSDAMPVSADFAVDLIGSVGSDLPDMLLEVKQLELAGLTLVSKLRVDGSDRVLSGPLRVSGKPDSTLLNAALQGAVGEAVPGLDVKPGDLLFKGLISLDMASSTPAWSAEGLLGLQKWQLTTEKAEAKRLTLSASLAMDEGRLQVFDQGEALSTVSADLSLLGLPFPAAFLKFTTDLSYGAGLPPGSDGGIAGTLGLSQARVGAFLGEVSLGSPLTLPLPLSRVSEAEPTHIPLRLRSVDLGALVALENEHIDATGTISGRLGLVYTGDSVQIPASAPGRLAADRGGRIRLKEAGQWQSMAGGNPQLLFAVGALGNFQYDSLKTSVIFDDDEWLKLGLELRGRNPEVMEARPIHYNLNVETNILSLLQSLEMTKNLSETLEQRLLKAYE